MTEQEAHLMLPERSRAGMYRKMVVAFDATAGSRVVLPMASALARAFDIEIALAAMIPDSRLARCATPSSGGPPRTRLDQNATSAREILSASGAKVDAQCYLCRTAEDVLEIMDGVGADAIALATRPTLQRGSLLRGMVEELARTTSGAVLRAGLGETQEFQPISDVIVPLDEFAEHTLSAAAEIARAADATITLILALPGDLWSLLDDPRGGNLPTRLLVSMEERGGIYLQAEALELRRRGLRVCTRFAPFEGMRWVVEKRTKACRMPLVIAPNQYRSLARRMLGPLADRLFFRSYTAPTLFVECGAK